MGKINLRNVVIGTAVGVGWGVVLAKKYYDTLDEECKLKENSKKLAEQAREWGKSVGEAAKRVYLTVEDKVSDISAEVKEKINKKKEQYNNETVENEEEYEYCDEEYDTKEDYEYCDEEYDDEDELVDYDEEYEENKFEDEDYEEAKDEENE